MGSVKKYFVIIFKIFVVLPSVELFNPINCNNKAFYCVNSTHFLICAGDLSNGESYTFSDQTFSCPASTECNIENEFECEIIPPTTSSPITQTSATIEYIKYNKSANSSTNGLSRETTVESANENHVFATTKEGSTVVHDTMIHEATTAESNMNSNTVKYETTSESKDFLTTTLKSNSLDESTSLKTMNTISETETILSTIISDMDSTTNTVTTQTTESNKRIGNTVTSSDKILPTENYKTTESVTLTDLPTTEFSNFNLPAEGYTDDINLITIDTTKYTDLTTKKNHDEENGKINANFFVTNEENNVTTENIRDIERTTSNNVYTSGEFTNFVSTTFSNNINETLVSSNDPFENHTNENNVDSTTDNYNIITLTESNLSEINDSNNSDKKSTPQNHITAKTSFTIVETTTDSQNHLGNDKYWTAQKDEDINGENTISSSTINLEIGESRYTTQTITNSQVSKENTDITAISLANYDSASQSAISTQFNRKDTTELQQTTTSFDETSSEATIKENLAAITSQSSVLDLETTDNGLIEGIKTTSYNSNDQISTNKSDLNEQGTNNETDSIVTENNQGNESITDVDTTSTVLLSNYSTEISTLSGTEATENGLIENIKTTSGNADGQISIAQNDLSGHSNKTNNDLTTDNYDNYNITNTNTVSTGSVSNYSTENDNLSTLTSSEMSESNYTIKNVSHGEVAMELIEGDHFIKETETTSISSVYTTDNDDSVSQSVIFTPFNRDNSTELQQTTTSVDEISLKSTVNKNVTTTTVQSSVLTVTTDNGPIEEITTTKGPNATTKLYPKEEGNKKGTEDLITTINKGKESVTDANTASTTPLNSYITETSRKASSTINVKTTRGLFQSNKTTDNGKSSNLDITTNITFSNEFGKTTEKSTTEFTLQKQNLIDVQIQDNNNQSNSHFDCHHLQRGRYAMDNDCTQFYLCFGLNEPLIVSCPHNSVFNNHKKQCMKDLSMCVRNHQFLCLTEGTFYDYSHKIFYYICVKKANNTFVRYTMMCPKNYYVNRTDAKCVRDRHHDNIHAHNDNDHNSDHQKNDHNQHDHRSKENSEENDHSKSKETEEEEQDFHSEENDHSKSKETEEEGQDFQCQKKGKFPNPHDCRKYYECSKRKDSFRLKKKKCHHKDVYNEHKQKCVSSKEYKCSTK